nr:hypothetical protein [Deltaproteobacteria bacterium]
MPWGRPSRRRVERRGPAARRDRAGASRDEHLAGAAPRDPQPRPRAQAFDKSRYRLTIIDVAHGGDGTGTGASKTTVIVTPTLVKKMPGPKTWIVGTSRPSTPSSRCSCRWPAGPSDSSYRAAVILDRGARIAWG